MYLLTFAHKNEASAFFDHFELRPHSDFPNLWTGKVLNVLITREGQYETLFQLQKALSTLPDITKVINLGVVGSLDNKLQAKDLVTIQTSYLALENKAQFKSFPLEIIPGIKKVDCLTNSIRVLDPGMRKELSPFAQCVDRELWANAFICKKNNLKLSSLKIVSDTGDEDKDISLCENVKVKALEYSEVLLNTFLTSIDLKENFHSSDSPDLEIFLENDFYFTLSMKRQMISLHQRVNLMDPETTRGDLLLKLISEAKRQELRPKARAQYLLNTLTKELNPLRSVVEERLEQLSHPMKSSGWNVKYDHHIEDNWIALSAKIQDKNQLFKLTQTLQHFPLEDWQQVFEGEE